MATLAVIGVAAAAVVLAAPDPRPSLRHETEALAARLVRAREEAVLTNRPVAATLDARGYGFTVWDGAAWTPLADGPFKARAWDDHTRATPPEGDGGRIVFDTTGGTEPATVRLTRGTQSLSVIVDGAGEVAVP